VQNLQEELPVLLLLADPVESTIDPRDTLVDLEDQAKEAFDDRFMAVPAEFWEIEAKARPGTNSSGIGCCWRDVDISCEVSQRDD
jgi:hypothetical protein